MMKASQGRLTKIGNRAHTQNLRQHLRVASSLRSWQLQYSRAPGPTHLKRPVTTSFLYMYARL